MKDNMVYADMQFQTQEIILFTFGGTQQFFKEKDKFVNWPMSKVIVIKILNFCKTGVERLTRYLKCKGCAITIWQQCTITSLGMSKLLNGNQMVRL